MSELKQSHLRNRRAKEKLTELKTLVDRIREGIFNVGIVESGDAAKQVLGRFLDKVWSDDEMFLLISEIVLHLRASLDHVVFVLARIDSGAEQDGTQFPINDCPQFFKKNRTGCLKHLTDEHVAFIESFQPYKGSNLKLLNRLSNVDKHRHFVRWSASGSFTTTRMNLGIDPAIRQTDPAIAGIQSSLRKVGMYFYRGPEILLDDGTPVGEALENLHSEVCNIIRESDAIILKTLQ
jgi:hypothetical protein